MRKNEAKVLIDEENIGFGSTFTLVVD